MPIGIQGSPTKPRPIGVGMPDIQAYMAATPARTAAAATPPVAPVAPPKAEPIAGFPAAATPPTPRPAPAGAPDIGAYMNASKPEPADPMLGWLRSLPDKPGSPKPGSGATSVGIAPIASASLSRSPSAAIAGSTPTPTPEAPERSFFLTPDQAQKSAQAEAAAKPAGPIKDAGAYMRQALDGNQAILARGGLDPRMFQSAMAQQAALLEQYGRHDANRLENDPTNAVTAMRGIMADPSARAGFFASKGLADPGPIGVPGGPVDAANYGVQSQSPENAALMGALSNPEQDLGQRLGIASRFPGVDQPGSPAHQLVQEYLNQQHAADPARFAEDTYVPPNPDSPDADGIFGTGYGVRAGGMLNALGTALNPWAKTSAGTGFGWRENYQQRSAQRDLLQRLQLQAPDAIPQ